MSQCAGHLCAMHKFSLTLTEINPEMADVGTGRARVILCLSRALFDRTCRVFYFPALAADIAWQSPRSHQRGRTAPPNLAILRILPMVAHSAVRR